MASDMSTTRRWISAEPTATSGGMATHQAPSCVSGAAAAGPPRARDMIPEGSACHSLTPEAFVAYFHSPLGHLLQDGVLRHVRGGAGPLRRVPSGRSEHRPPHFQRRRHLGHHDPGRMQAAVLGDGGLRGH